MAYSTTADVQNAAGGAAMLTALSDFDGDGAQDAAVIAAAIAAADAEIDSYAHKRFRTPFAATVPPKIVELSARLAVFKMRTQRNTLTQGDIEVHTADTKWLEGLRDGDNDPGVEPMPTKSSLMVDEAGQRDSIKDVSRNSMKGFW
jgi:phage gp36-like protein